MASGRIRFALGFTAVGAVLVITGLVMVLLGELLRLKSAQGGPGIARLGEFVALSGLGIGVSLLVTLTFGRSNRAARKSARDDRARADRRRAAPAGRARRRRATGGEAQFNPRHEQAEQWLTPLRPPWAGFAPQPVLPSWPEQAQERQPADDYADDGWRPDSGEGWTPGPLYVRNPGEADVWDRGGERAWDTAAAEGWDMAGDPGIVSWPTGEPRGADGNGPQPAYLAGPGPGQGSRAAGYAGDPDVEHLAGPDGGYLVREPLDDTSPIPVVQAPGQPAPTSRPSEDVPAAEPFSVWEPAPKPGAQRDPGVYQPAHAEPPADTQEKLDQIKDLYVTAEAIGEDALGRHFDQIRQRQHALIREFFEKAGLGSNTTPPPPGDDSAPDGAPLVG